MTELITTLTFIFGASTLAVIVSRILKQPAIPLYILAGILISSQVPQSQILELSQLGISFLIFIYGVRFSTGKLQSVASEGLAVSAISLIFTAGISVIISSFMGFKWIETIVFTAAAAFSSSLVGLELIKDDLSKELVHSRLVESVQLIEDLVAVVLILVVFSQNPLEALLKGSGILVSAFAFKQVFPYFAESFKDSTESIMIFSLAVLAVFASLSHFLDVSLVLAAFAAGLSLSKYPYSIEIVDTVGSLKDFFTAVLFVSIGSIAFTTSFKVFSIAAVLLFLTLLVKPFIVYGSLRSIGRDSRISFLTSLGLDQVSEFAVIVAIQAFIFGEIGEPLLQSVVLATAFTMTFSAYTNRKEHWMYSKFSEFFSTDNVAESNFDVVDGHVVLVGFDVQGRQLFEQLEEEKVDTVVIEYDPEKVEFLKSREAKYVFGDVMNQEAWIEADYRDADLIVSTVPLRHVSDKIISLETDADKILRSPDVKQAKWLMEEGATFVSVPDILSAQRLVEHLKGIFNNPDYRKELRRKNLLELREKQEHQ